MAPGRPVGAGARTRRGRRHRGSPARLRALASRPVRARTAGAAWTRSAVHPRIVGPRGRERAPSSPAAPRPRRPQPRDPRATRRLRRRCDPGGSSPRALLGVGLFPEDVRPAVVLSDPRRVLDAQGLRAAVAPDTEAHHSGDPATPRPPPAVREGKGGSGGTRPGSGRGGTGAWSSGSREGPRWVAGRGKRVAHRLTPETPNSTLTRTKRS